MSREPDSCFYYSTIFVYPAGAAQNLSWVKEGFDIQARALKARAESVE